MKSQSKKLSNSMIDVIILILLYVAVASFPFSLFIKDNLTLSTSLSIGLITIYLIFLVLFIKNKKNLAIEKRKFSIKNSLLFLPCILAFFSNYFYLPFVPFNFKIDSMFPLLIVFTLITVLIEEILFRGLLFEQLSNFTPIPKILISAGIFGFCHINHFLSTFNPLDLITILYTFGIGIILGMFYEFGGSFITIICFHFLYNFFNNILFNCFKMTNINYPNYYLINIGVSLILIIYLLIIFISKFRTSKKQN